MNCTKSVMLVLVVSLLSGCAMCANPFDEFYAAYGGSRPRADMLAGRVGSKFVEAGQWCETDPLPTPAATDDGSVIEGDYESSVIQDDYYESTPSEIIEGDSYESGSSTRFQLNEAVDNVLEDMQSP